MKSKRTRRFRKLYESLPPDVRRRADAAYRLWRENMQHPSLHFKRLEALGTGVYSARINDDYRAVGHFEDNGDFVWDWIGSHKEFDQLG